MRLDKNKMMKWPNLLASSRQWQYSFLAGGEIDLHSAKAASSRPNEHRAVAALWPGIRRAAACWRRIIAILNELNAIFIKCREIGVLFLLMSRGDARLISNSRRRVP